MDLVFLSKIFIRKKYIILMLVPMLMYMFLIKEGRSKIYFKTTGVLYIVNESKVFGISNDALKKILPDYDFESEKESLIEFIKSPVVLERTIVKTGYNAYFHSSEEDYKDHGISVYKWLTKIKNIYKLKKHNIFENYRVINAEILNDRIKKVTFKIIFNNNTVEIFDITGKKIGFLNLKHKSVFENNSVRFKIEKLSSVKKVYDAKIFLTISNQNYVVDEVVDKISINKTKRSALTKVSIKGDNPFLIKDFTDILMREFINYNIELKFKNIDQIAKYLNNELAKLVKKRNRYLKNIYEIEKNVNMSVSPNTSLQLSMQVAFYSKKIDELTSDLKRLKYLKKKLKENKISKTYISEGKMVFSSITKLTGMLLAEIKKFKEISLEYTKLAPKYQQQVEKIKKLKEMLETELEYKMKDLELQIEQTKTMLLKYNNKSFANSEASRKINSYLEEIKIIDKVRKDIYAHLENLMVDRVFIKYGNKIMKEAKLPYDISNPIKNKIIFNMILSVLFSLAIIVIKHFVFPVFYSKMEIPKKDEIIGGIPQISEKMLKNGIIKFSKDNKMFELFRLLMSMMVINNKNFKVILFTSSYPGDGRTFMAMNFAAMSAISKKRVLVITIYPINLNTDKSIYNFNEVLDFEKKAEKVEINIDTYFYRFYCVSKNYDRNIDISDNDNEVYAIIKKLKDKCDLIIFDCLAYPMYADTFLYAPSCDMIFSVLRLNHTPTKIYGKHLNDLDKYIKDYNIIINSDRVNLNSSGYILEEKGTIAYYKEKIKYFIAKL